MKSLIEKIKSENIKVLSENNKKLEGIKNYDMTSWSLAKSISNVSSILQQIVSTINLKEQIVKSYRDFNPQGSAQIVINTGRTGAQNPSTPPPQILEAFEAIQKLTKSKNDCEQILSNLNEIDGLLRPIVANNAQFIQSQIEIIRNLEVKMTDLEKLQTDLLTQNFYSQLDLVVLEIKNKINHFPDKKLLENTDCLEYFDEKFIDQIIQKFTTIISNPAYKDIVSKLTNTDKLTKTQ